MQTSCFVKVNTVLIYIRTLLGQESSCSLLCSILIHVEGEKDVQLKEAGQYVRAMLCSRNVCVYTCFRSTLVRSELYVSYYLDTVNILLHLYLQPPSLANCILHPFVVLLKNCRNSFATRAVIRHSPVVFDESYLRPHKRTSFISLFCLLCVTKGQLYFQLVI